MGSTAVRAVGSALARNPVPIIIPCHRVVARNGIGGFSCGVDMKIKLIELELKYLRLFNLF
ncbi:MAG: MGMT family protein [Candidatus Methanoperedens sp.]|nr:MGMT family protein [Candidatus Methanoperedens sp.]